VEYGGDPCVHLTEAEKEARGPEPEPASLSAGSLQTGLEATTGVEPADQSNTSVEPRIDVLLFILMLKRRCGS
jgi:hypothetical protein